MRPLISFIVPVLNGPGLTLEFLQNLTAQNCGYGEKYEVIFVDNGSNQATQNVLAMLQNHNPDCVRIVRNETNEGFGPANNIGSAYARGNVLVFTQTDVVFSGDTVTLLESVEDLTLYGSRLLSHDTGWNKFGSVVVPYLEGWFLACTRKTWDILEGFDPIYVPADFEDVDLSYTAILKGVLLQQLPLPVRHDHMGKAGWSQFTEREKVTIQHRELFRQKWGL
jgi:O-antigen biosynthesis protein